MLKIAATRAKLTEEETIGVRNWLIEQLVSQEFAKLEQGGHTKNTVPLRSVFVDLPVARTKAAYSDDSRRLFLSSLLSSSPLDLHKICAAQKSTELSTSSTRRVLQHLYAGNSPFSSSLLIGGPGQGKSTLSQLASQLHRAALLIDQLDVMTLMQKHLVESFVPHEHESNLWPQSPLLPLQIVLPDLSTWLALSENQVQEENYPVILKYLQHLPSAKNANLSISALIRILKVVPALLIFDGFDEVGAEDDRRRLVIAIRELIFYLAGNHIAAQIIATTRPQGYAGELENLGVQLVQHYLLPLTKTEAMDYAKRLINAKINGADERSKMLKKMIDAANDSSTARLLTTPLQVTILTALVQQMGRAPRERWNLFNKYFEFTYDREIERETYASALLAAYRRQVELIHSRVGMILQIEAERDGGASAKMPRERLIEVISHVLAEDGFDDRKLEDLTYQIAIAAENRLVFLVEPEPGFFGFEIRSLQEFMAAWALTSGSPTEVQQRAQAIAHSSIFRNVLLFVTSKLYSENSAMREELPRLLCSPGQSDIDKKSNIGAILALEILEEGAVLSQPKRARALMGQAAFLLNEPPTDLTYRLASIANEDTLAVLLNCIDSNLVNSKKSNELANWVCLIHCAVLHGNVAEEIAERHWKSLHDLKEVISYVARTGSHVTNWFAKQVENTAALADPYMFRQLTVLGNPADSWVAWISDVSRSVARTAYEGPDDYNEIITESKWIGPPSYQTPSAWEECVRHMLFEVDPSIKNLRDFATVFKIIPSSEEDNWLISTISSWPIASVRLTISSESARTKVISALDNGVLGDVKDWREAQLKWRDPVGYEIGKKSLQLPWAEDLSVPPLLAMSNWFVASLSGSALHEMYKCLSYLKKSTKHVRLRSWLAKSALFCVRYLEGKYELDSEIVEDHLQQVRDGILILTPKPRNIQEREWQRWVKKYCPVDEIDWAINPASLFLNSRRKRPDNLIVTLALRCVNRFLIGTGFEKADENKDYGPLISSIDAVDPLAAAVISLYYGLESEVQVELLKSFFVDSTQYDRSVLPVLQASIYAIKNRRCKRHHAELLAYALHLIPQSETGLLIDAILELRWALGLRRTNLNIESLWQQADSSTSKSDLASARHKNSELDPPIWIEQLELSDIGRFKKIILEPTRPTSDSGQWIVILGKNGAGKSTLLRSLVVALRNVKDPALWPARTFNRDWLLISKEGEQVPSGRIKIKLAESSDAHHTFVLGGQSLTFVQSPELNYSAVVPVFGYGCRRGSALGGPEREVDLADGLEVFTLMDDSYSLIHAETWIKDLDGDALKNPRSKLIFDRVLLSLCNLLNVSDIFVRNRKVLVREVSGVVLPFSELSDGYLTNAGWFVDLIARWLEKYGMDDYAIQGDFLKRMTGLVLIDEIDLHLHPRWQAEIISRTRALLPKMSFVVTTHNPLTLVGARADEIWIIEDNESSQPQLRRGIDSPMLLSGGQIYKRYFGIEDIYPSPVGRAMERLMFFTGLDFLEKDEVDEVEELKKYLIASGIPISQLEQILKDSQ